MSESPLIFKVFCPIAGVFPRLEVPQDQEPEAKHFFCYLGICSNQGVICNYGGKPCSQVPESVKEARKLYLKNRQNSSPEEKTI